MCDWNFVGNNEEENHQRFKSEGITWFLAMESRQAAPSHLQFGVGNPPVELRLEVTS